MQVNLNNQTRNPQFGMAIHISPKVNEVIKSRVKRAETIEKLDKIIKNQRSNPEVDITLFANPDRTLSAEVFRNHYIAGQDKFNVFRQFQESKTSKLFGGVVSFWEKVTKYADEKTGQIIDSKTSKLNNHKV